MAVCVFQKGLRGNCVLLPNASMDTDASFPPQSLGETFVAAFVGTNATDFSHAQFGTVHREEFQTQASFLQQHNQIYRQAKYRGDVVNKWPSGESLHLSLIHI